MKKLISGIDISKNTLDYCILDYQKVQVESRGIIDNTPKAINQWLKNFDKNNDTFA